MLKEQKELRHIVAKLSCNNPKVFNHFISQAKSTLANLNQSDTAIRVDVECGISHSVLQMLIRIDGGTLRFPDDIKDKEAFVMYQLQHHVNFYLLKRFARRTSKKPLDTYNKEKEHANGERVNKHAGNRFDSIDRFNEENYFDGLDSFADINYIDESFFAVNDNAYALEIDHLIKILESKNLSERDLIILAYRLQSYTYDEIANLVKVTKSGSDAATGESIRKEHTRVMKKANIDVSAFKEHAR
jgi:hypothetical protein